MIRSVVSREARYCDTKPPAPALLSLPHVQFWKPKTAGDWIVRIAGAIVSIFLVWWMLRMFVL